MNVRPIGVLRMEDDGGGDEKIIAVPSSRITQRYVNVKTHTDLPEITRHQIEHFFVHYKDLEPGKWVKLLGWGDVAEAHRLIAEAIDRAKRKNDRRSLRPRDNLSLKCLWPRPAMPGIRCRRDLVAEGIMESTSQLFGNGLKYFSELVAIELRNMEAIGLAQQKMLEGMGVLAQRQAEIVQGTLRRSFGAQSPGTDGSLPASASGVQAMVIGQITSFKTTMLENQANSNILSELAARSSGEVADILQSRMIAALDEFKAALEQAIPQVPAPAPASLTVQPGPQA